MSWRLLSLSALPPRLSASRNIIQTASISRISLSFSSFSASFSSEATAVPTPSNDDAGMPAMCFASNPDPLTPRFALNNITDLPGSRRKETRVGRGPGSKHGKTSGRGMKGENSRSGSSGQVWYQGGATALFRRLPKMFEMRRVVRRPLQPLNLGRLMEWIKAGRIDATQVLTLKTLYDSGVCGQFKHGVKLLATGSEKVDRPLKLQVSHASETAKAAIEKAGGTVEYVWFNRVTLRAHLKPHKFQILPHSDGIPPPRLYKRYPHLAPTHSFRHMEDQEVAVEQYEFVPDYLREAAEIHAREKAEKLQAASKKKAALSATKT